MKAAVLGFTILISGSAHAFEGVKHICLQRQIDTVAAAFAAKISKPADEVRVVDIIPGNGGTILNNEDEDNRIIVSWKQPGFLPKTLRGEYLVESKLDEQKEDCKVEQVKLLDFMTLQ